MNTSVVPEFKSLKSKGDIQKLLETGRKIHTKFGIFFLEKTTDQAAVSFAALIKKTVGNAVKRNYRKRILREYVRENIEKFKSFNKIAFLYNYSGEVSYSTLSLELDKKLMIL